MGGYLRRHGISHNAAIARDAGRFPASHVAKELGVPSKFISEYSDEFWGGEWHHCSRYANRVPHYSIEAVREYLETAQGKEALREFKADQRSLAKQRKDKRLAGIDPDEPASSEDALGAVRNEYGQATRIGKYCKRVWNYEAVREAGIHHLVYIQFDRKKRRYVPREAGYVIALIDEARYLAACAEIAKRREGPIPKRDLTERKAG